MELLWNTLGFPFTDFILLFWLSSCLNMNVSTIFLFSSVTYALIYCTLPLGIGPTCLPRAEIYISTADFSSKPQASSFDSGWDISSMMPHRQSKSNISSIKLTFLSQTYSHLGK